MKITDAMVEAAQKTYADRYATYIHTDVCRNLLEAALSAGVADQEPDAEFAAALDEYRRAAMKLQHIQTVTYRRNPSEHDVDQLDDASVRFDAARARVLALYADARNAGLRELRSSIEHQIVFWEGRTVADPPEHYGWVLEEIESMLGGDGE